MTASTESPAAGGHRHASSPLGMLQPPLGRRSLGAAQQLAGVQQLPVKSLLPGLEAAAQPWMLDVRLRPSGAPAAAAFPSKLAAISSIGVPHGMPSYQLCKGLPSRDSPVGWLPTSKSAAVHSPFSSPLPGSKVRPCPHNLVPLAAIISNSAAIAAAHKQQHQHQQHQVKPLPHKASPRTRDTSPAAESQPVQAALLPPPPLPPVAEPSLKPATAATAPPVISSHVVVGTVVSQPGRHASPPASRPANQLGPAVALRPAAQPAIPAGACAWESSEQLMAGLAVATRWPTQQQQQQQQLGGSLPAAHPAFMYALSLPLTRSLPARHRTPVLKATPTKPPAPPARTPGGGSLAQAGAAAGHPAWGHHHVALPATPDTAFSPWPVTPPSASPGVAVAKQTNSGLSLLVDAVSSTVPTIRPGQGLAQHVAAVRAPAQPHPQPSAPPKHAVASVAFNVEAHIAAILDEELHAELDSRVSTACLEARVQQSPQARPAAAHLLEQPAPAQRSEAAQPVDVAAQLAAPPQACDHAGTVLAAGVQQVLDVLQSEIAAPLDEGLVTLKTRQTHHKAGPLPQFTPPVIPGGISRDNAQESGPDASTLPASAPPPACRSPMFTRRTQVPAAAQRAQSPSLRQLEDSGGAGTPAVAAALAGATTSNVGDSPILPPNIVVDVEAAHKEATARLAQAQADAAAAAAAAAATAAAAELAAAAQASRPCTRQGLSEVVATVGAALESAATQLLAKSGSMERGPVGSQPHAATAASSCELQGADMTLAPPAPEQQPQVPEAQGVAQSTSTAEPAAGEDAAQPAMEAAAAPQGVAQTPGAARDVAAATSAEQQGVPAPDVEMISGLEGVDVLPVEPLLDITAGDTLLSSALNTHSSFYFEGSDAGDTLTQPYMEASLARMMRGSDRSSRGVVDMDAEEGSTTYGEDADEDMGSEAGEILSVSAYGITPAQPLLTKSASRRSQPSIEAEPNDVHEHGVRVLGQKYEVLEVVGEGAYGKVMRCRMRGADPERFVAIKEFKITDGDADAEDVKRTARREISLLRSLQHPHVVACLDDFYVRDRLFIVMEFVPCNLLELLEAQPGGLSSEAVRLIMYQLCTAMSYIHSKNVVYRDIKPENLLVDEQGRLKLCDFGFARFQPGSADEHLTDYVATRWYRAPELLLGPPFRDGSNVLVQYRYGPAVDIWAMGCLMGELKDTQPLFPGDSDLDQLYRIQLMLGKIPASQQQMFDTNPGNIGIYFNIKEPMTLAARYEGIMDEVELSFMSGLLALDPAQRLSCQQALEHPYLRDLWLADTQSSGGEYLSTTNILTQVPGYDASATAYETGASSPGPDYAGQSDDGAHPNNATRMQECHSARDSTFTLHPDLVALAAAEDGGQT